MIEGKKLMQFRPLLHAGITIVAIVSTGCTKEARMRIRAERGDPQAMREYGDYLIAERPRNFYLDGDEGYRWIEKAANNGNKQAM